jgi:hypothetical protein
MIALALSITTSLIVELIASTFYLTTALITLLRYVRHQLHQVANNDVIYPGSAIYFTLISNPLLFFTFFSVSAKDGHSRIEKSSFDTINSKSVFEA